MVAFTGNYEVQRFVAETKTWKTVATASTLAQAQMILGRMTQPSIVSNMSAPKMRIQRKEGVNGK